MNSKNYLVTASHALKGLLIFVKLVTNDVQWQFGWWCCDEVSGGSESDGEMCAGWVCSDYVWGGWAWWWWLDVWRWLLARWQFICGPEMCGHYAVVMDVPTWIKWGLGFGGTENRFEGLHLDTHKQKEQRLG